MSLVGFVKAMAKDKSGESDASAFRSFLVGQTFGAGTWNGVSIEPNLTTTVGSCRVSTKYYVIGITIQLLSNGFQCSSGMTCVMIRRELPTTVCMYGDIGVFLTGSGFEDGVWQ